MTQFFKRFNLFFIVFQLTIAPLFADIPDLNILEKSRSILNIYRDSLGTDALRKTCQSDDITSRFHDNNPKANIAKADFDRAFEHWLSNQELQIQDLVTLTQTFFLRPAGSERSDDQSLKFYGMRAQNLTPEARAQIIQTFTNLKMLEDIDPQFESPDCIIIQGSTVPVMRRNLHLLNTWVNDGTIKLHSKTKVYFLVGERPLFKAETPDVLNSPAPLKPAAHWKALDAGDLPQDERTAARLLVKQSDLNAQLKAHIGFVEAEKRAGQSRAQTEDCVKLFLQQYPEKRAQILVFSTNPMILYQEKVFILNVAKYARDVQFDIQSCGHAERIKDYPQDVVLGVLMDTLARILYVEEELERVKLHP